VSVSIRGWAASLRRGARLGPGTAAALIAFVWGGVGAFVAVPASAQTPPAGPSGAPSLPVDVAGATHIEYDAATEQYTFRGPQVVITRGDERLAGPVVYYAATTRRAELPEHGTVSTPAETLSADHIVAELNARHLIADGRADGKFLDQGVWTSLTADRLEVRDQGDVRDVVATGHVIAVRGDEELRGDRVTYDRATQHATVEGSAVLTRGEDRLQADQIAVDTATRDAVASGHVVLDRASEHVHGVADRGTYAGGTATAVLSGHVVLTRDRDVVTAETITMRLNQHVAVADGPATIVAYPREGEPGPTP